MLSTLSENGGSTADPDPGCRPRSCQHQQISRLSGSRSEIVFRPLPTDDPKVRQPDIGKARRLLKWEPKVDVEEGLTRTIDWCRKLVAHP